MINPSSFNLLLSLGGWRLADRLLCYLCSFSVYLKQIVPWKMIGPHGLELIPARAILQGKKKRVKASSWVSSLEVQLVPHTTDVLICQPNAI